MMEVIRSGSRIAVVDLGRSGYLRYGVPRGGAMDIHSTMVANALVGNPLHAGVLELMRGRYRFRFYKDTYIAISGASVRALVDDVPLEGNHLLKVREGQVLSIEKFILGVRLYIAVQGGILSDPVLGSRSQLAHYFDAVLSSRDRLMINDCHLVDLRHAHIRPHQIDLDHPIHVSKGPEWHQLKPSEQEHLMTCTFRISPQSDTMGYRLDGQKVDTCYAGIISSPVMAGTIQLLPSGLPIVLMRDCQTTGGYLRILQMTAASINQLAQRTAGHEVRFELVAG